MLINAFKVNAKINMLVIFLSVNRSYNEVIHAIFRNWFDTSILSIWNHALLHNQWEVFEEGCVLVAVNCLKEAVLSNVGINDIFWGDSIQIEISWHDWAIFSIHDAECLFLVICALIT